LAALESGKTAGDFVLLERFLFYQIRLDGLHIGLGPLEHRVEDFSVRDRIRAFEKSTRLSKQEVVRDDEFLLLLGVLIVLADFLKSCLDRAVFFNQLECLDRSNAANRDGVVTAAHNTKVDELVHAHIESFEHCAKLNLRHGLFLTVKASDEELGAESKRIHIFSSGAKRHTHLDELGALGFSLARGLNDRDTHHAHEFLGVLHHLACDSDRPARQLFRTLHVTRCDGLLFFFLSGLFHLLAFLELFAFHVWCLAVEDPDWFHSIFHKLHRAVEQTDEVASQVSIGVFELTDARGCGSTHPREALRSDQKLVNRHRSITGDNLASHVI